VTEKTFALIKSAALMRRQAPAIIQRILYTGFSISAIRANASLAGEHEDTQLFEALYKEHVGRPYYEGLLKSVTSPYHAMALVIEGDSVIQAWRTMMGPTNPQVAPAGTIRGDFGGTILPDNAVHGSDSPEAAAREIALFFGTMKNSPTNPGIPADALLSIAGYFGQRNEHSQRSFSSPKG
jgi:nucleoside-diphosphate kinase